MKDPIKESRAFHLGILTKTVLELLDLYRNDNKYKKIKIADILYVSAEGSYCLIKTATKEYILSLNLNTFNQRLGHPKLIRVHRSYVINTDSVDSFELDRVHIKEHDIPISRRYKDEFLNCMKYI